MIAGDPGPVLIISSRMGNSWPNNPAHLDPIPTILNHHLLIITNTQHCVSRRCVNSLNPSLLARNWRPTTRRDKKVKIARNSTRGLILRWYFANCGCNVTWSIIELSHSSRCRQCPDPNYDIGNKNVAKSQQSWPNHQHVAALSLPISDKADLGHFLDGNTLLSVIQLNS